jgi:hypothetical protein
LRAQLGKSAEGSAAQQIHVRLREDTSEYSSDSEFSDDGAPEKLASFSVCAVACYICGMKTALVVSRGKRFLAGFLPNFERRLRIKTNLINARKCMASLAGAEEP